MNCASGADQVEFYAAPSAATNGGGGANAEITKLFASPSRSKLTYSGDGRRFINGNLDRRLSQPSPPENLWRKIVTNQVATHCIPADENGEHGEHDEHDEHDDSDNDDSKVDDAIKSVATRASQPAIVAASAATTTTTTTSTTNEKKPRTSTNVKKTVVAFFAAAAAATKKPNSRSPPPSSPSPPHDARTTSASQS